MSQHTRRSSSLSTLEEGRHPRHHTTRLRKLPDCRLCKRDHPLRTCRQFQKLNVTKKLQIVKKHHYCENCLAHSHLLRKCRSTERCRKCGRRHHTLLHRHERLLTTEKPKGDTGSQIISLTRSVTLVPTVIITMKLRNEWGNIRGLLDPSVEQSKIAEFIPKRYDLPIEKSGSDRFCKISFKPHFSDGPTLAITVQIANDLPRKLRVEDLDERTTDHYKNLRLADPKFYTSCDINIILAADVYPRIIKPNIHQETLATPMAQDTILGWTLIGKFGI